MLRNTTHPIPTNGVEKLAFDLQQTGHLWFVEKRVKEWGMNDLYDENSLVIEIRNLLYDWDISAATVVVRAYLKDLWETHPQWHNQGYTLKLEKPVDRGSNSKNAYAALIKGDRFNARRFNVKHVESVFHIDYDRVTVVFNDNSTTVYRGLQALWIRDGIKHWKHYQHPNSNVWVYLPQ